MLQQLQQVVKGSSTKLSIQHEYTTFRLSIQHD